MSGHNHGGGDFVFLFWMLSGMVILGIAMKYFGWFIEQAIKTAK